MIAPTPEQPLIPPAARLDIGHGNEGLWTHGDLLEGSEYTAAGAWELLVYRL
jgi:hypothetical protein